MVYSKSNIVVGSVVIAMFDSMVLLEAVAFQETSGVMVILARDVVIVVVLILSRRSRDADATDVATVTDAAALRNDITR